jgi:hypothetical protein
MCHTARLAGAAAALILTLSGCSRSPSAPVASAPAAPESSAPSPPIRLTGWIDPAPNLYREIPLTEDLPTFTMDGHASFSYPGGPGLSLPEPKIQGQVNAQAVLSQIAAAVDQSGKPDVPPGLPAAFGGALEGGHYVYRLGGVPKDVYGPLVYMLTKQPDGWEATPICNRSWAWVWPGTTEQAKDPVVVCAYIEGSGANLNPAAYKAGREVLRVEGLSDSYVQVIPVADGGAPTIIAYGSHHWLDNKAEPAVFERYVFTWQDGSYALTTQERRADWVYHFARLVAMLAKGEPEGALTDFAEPPPGGVPAYIDQVAPDMRKSAAGRWTTAGAPTGSEWPPARAHIRPVGSVSGPWFAFELDGQGLIRSVSEQTEPPK